jgi:hypothetical protein
MRGLRRRQFGRRGKYIEHATGELGLHVRQGNRKQWAIGRTFGKLPAGCVRTTTLDNGKEFAAHREIATAIGGVSTAGVGENSKIRFAPVPILGETCGYPIGARTLPRNRPGSFCIVAILWT